MNIQEAYENKDYAYFRNKHISADVVERCIAMMSKRQLTEDVLALMANPIFREAARQFEIRRRKSEQAKGGYKNEF